MEQAEENICDELGVALRRAALLVAPPEIIDSLTIPVARAVDETRGDFQSNLALQLARPLKQKPIEIAESLVARLEGPFESSAAAPGFINFRIAASKFHENLRATATDGWSRSATGGGRRVNIEYVSANPTGELHVGHGRGAVLGDTIARLLGHCGFDVTREYYLNNVGKQVEALGESLLAAAGRLRPDGSSWSATYPVAAAAEAFAAAHPASATPDEAARFAMDFYLGRIMELLADLSIRFDAVTPEAGLLVGVAGLIEELRGRDLLYEATEAEGEGERVRRADSKAARHQEAMEGGTFLRTSRFGDETDRIILRAGGAPTYFTSDILYHREKFRRGFDRLINVWGADHGGHVARLRAALEALGQPAERLEVVLCQMVRLIRDGAEFKMSKRSGNLVTLRELVEEAGADAVRFFFLLRASDSQFDFDLDLAKSRTTENPVYYCQYAHARTCRILEKAREATLAPGEAQLELLTADPERRILMELIALPETIRSAAVRLEPHRLASAAMNLARVFHSYQTLGKADQELRVIRADRPELSAARLRLVQGVGAAMKKLLELMGVSAPERM
jgi:arginyl-tRNA synthetase